MKTSDIPPGLAIGEKVQQFESFAEAASDFFSGFHAEDIFTEQPPDNSCGCVAAHLAEGRYLLKVFRYQFQKSACEKAVSGLLEIFGRHLPVGAERLARIEETFSSGKLDAREFIETIFRNQEDRFLEAVERNGLEEELMTLFAVYLARPMRAQAAVHLCEVTDLSDWTHGYCPVCGHRPALAHLEKGAPLRTLWCVSCGTEWASEPVQCAQCLGDDGDKLELLGPPDEPAFKVLACHGCKEYLKEIHGESAGARLRFDAYFLGAQELDRIAWERGFVQKSPLAAGADGSEARLLTHRMRMPW